jgi:hypothetical protein
MLLAASVQHAYSLQMLLLEKVFKFENVCYGLSSRETEMFLPITGYLDCLIVVLRHAM